MIVELIKKIRCLLLSLLLIMISFLSLLNSNKVKEAKKEVTINNLEILSFKKSMPSLSWTNYSRQIIPDETSQSGHMAFVVNLGSSGTAYSIADID